MCRMARSADRATKVFIKPLRSEAEAEADILNTNGKSLVLVILKGLSVIDHSKLHFFPNLQIFWHIQRELHCTNLYICPLRNIIFLGRETILCYWELVTTGGD